jgi:hypothetical protein
LYNNNTTINNNTMAELNISQLRNLWLRSPDERLACWREFRIEAQTVYSNCAGNPLPILESISTWWDQVPLVSVAMDPYNFETWPTIWEIIHQGECCKYSRGLAMACNIHYIDRDVTVTLDRVHDHTYHDEYLIATYNNEFVLNSLHGAVISIHDAASLEIRETWDIQAVLTNT